MINLAGVQRRFGGLMLEAAMVVFAVLLALGVDEWRQTAALQEQVDRARAGVEAELRSNQAELAVSMASIADMNESVRARINALRAGDLAPEWRLGGELPEFSDAAWEAAQVTGVVARMDYQWVLTTARVYDTQRLASQSQLRLIEMVGAASLRRPDLDRFEELRVQLFVALQLYQALAIKYDEALAAFDTP
jgi:hypothetical protein